MTTEDQKIKQKRKSIERSLSGYPFPKLEILKDRKDPKFVNEYAYALNYANYIFEHDELKDYSQKFADELMDRLSLSKIPDWEFMSIGKLTWLHSRGVVYDENSIDEIKSKLKSLYNKYNVTEKKPVDLKTRRTGNLMGELEGILDDIIMKKSNVVQPAKLIESTGAVDIEKIKEHFQAQLNEVSDPQLKEYFPDGKRLAVGLSIIIKDLDKLKTVKTTTRKTRVMTPRKINPTKMVRKLKYLKDFKELNLVSMTPEKIVGAQILWVYNVKTRKLGRYVAKNETSGLIVKGSTILEYDETQSTSKKLRKPVETIGELMAAGKVEQRKILGAIKAVENKLNGRVNKDTILIKVY